MGKRFKGFLRAPQLRNGDEVRADQAKLGMAEGARFEAPETLETIDHDLTESSDSPALTDEKEEDREPIKADRKG